MLLFEGNFVPAGDDVVEFGGILNGELVAGGVPRGGEDEFLELGMVLFESFGLALCIRMEDVVLGLMLFLDVTFQSDV